MHRGAPEILRARMQAVFLSNKAEDLQPDIHFQSIPGVLEKSSNK